VAIVAGAAGEREFGDEVVRSPEIAGLRRQVDVAIDPALGKAQARVAVSLKNGERHAVFVEHAVGSVQNPMSDMMIEEKFRGLTRGALPDGGADRILTLCRTAATLEDAGEIVRAAGT
jgi:2-methylcitrate dehydratase PrpD